MKPYELLKTIGQNVRNVRKEKGVKGETLAKELRVTKQAISQIELGLIDLKFSTLHQIATALDTNITYLIEGIQSVESQFSDYRFETERHLRTVNLLVSRIEYMHEKIECMKQGAETF